MATEIANPITATAEADPVSSALGRLALPTPDAQESRDVLASLESFFSPRSVAVVGASHQRGSIGSEILHNLVAYGFTGPVYPVNAHAPVVQSMPAYPSVEAIPAPVDLAVVAVPAAAVLEVARACARNGIKALLVITAGFAETGPEGVAAQRELLKICRDNGMRMIGPNCMGVVNTDPAIRLDATFAPTMPARGNIGFLSQSGALGLAILESAQKLGLGISTFLSVGNKADVSGNDLLQYWEADTATDVILLYLESFGNVRKFSRLARRISRSKPIVAVKSGRSSAGARAASSHTGALLAASDSAVDALFRQAGVIRTNTLEELFDVATLLANQPLPTGRRVGILTNAGGPAILATDACEANGLEIAPLAPETQQRLREFLPAQASTTNPVDMIASAPAEAFRRAIEIMSADANVDALIVIFVPPLVTRSEDVAEAIMQGAQSLARPLPVLTVFMSAKGVPEQLRRDGLRIPSFPFPESAAIALARAAGYAEWRRRPPSPFVSPDGIDHAAACGLIDAAAARGDEWLSAADTSRLLRAYGLPIARQGFASNADAAVALAAAFGGAVVLKAVAPGLVHKSDIGAVRVGLAGESAIRLAASEIESAVTRAHRPLQGYLVQQMAPPGLEMIVGAALDANFGPVLACGTGGVNVELLNDVAVRLAPVTRADISEMLRSLKMFPLLNGYRGSPRLDSQALEDAILRVNSLVEAHPRVAELDLNPIIVSEHGAMIVDARIRLSIPPVA
jgi:acetyl coenzyme A synthetase (ADP forming)-like protein